MWKALILISLAINVAAIGPLGWTWQRTERTSLADQVAPTSETRMVELQCRGEWRWV
jgi:hypothetical protein